MIQSRPQFGYIGAILVWLFAYIQYAGFNIFNTLLGCPGDGHDGARRHKLWIVVLTVAAVVAAVIGYDFIHKMERGLTYGFLVLFGILTIVILTLHYPAGSFDLGNFDLTPFLLQYSVVAGYQISWAIYVSDYSRYLPPDVTVRKTFYWTYGGSALGAIWIMCIGSALAAWAGSGFDPVGSLYDAGNEFFSGFGDIILVFSALGLVSVMALNLYGGSLTLISASDSFKRVQPTLNVRLVTIGFTALISLVLALFSTSSFQANFEDFLLLVLYLFIPWTAVNLVDYFIVRRGHYAIAEIFDPHGIYGRWCGGGSRPTSSGSPRWCRSSAPVPTPARSRRRRTARTTPCSSVCRWPASSTGCSPAASTSRRRPSWRGVSRRSSRRRRCVTRVRRPARPPGDVAVHRQLGSGGAPT